MEIVSCNEMEKIAKHYVSYRFFPFRFFFLRGFYVCELSDKRVKTSAVKAENGKEKAET